MMKKITLFTVVAIFSLLLPIVSAENEIGVEVIEISNEVEAGGKAEYQLKITNYQGEKDIYKLTYDELLVYPFSDFARSIIANPVQVKINPLESGIINLTINVLETAREDRPYETEIKLSSITNSEIKQNVTLKTYVVSPKDIILIFPEIPDEIIPGQKYDVKIKFKNRGNVRLENYEILISSDFPQLQKNFVIDFEPKEEITETITIKPNEHVSADNHVVNIKVYDIEGKTRGSYSSAFTIRKNENIQEQLDEQNGFLTKTTIITKKNNGNTISDQKIEAKINPISRLFTNTQPDPKVENGKYIWNLKLEPGDEFSVEFTTNYKPLFYGLLIIIITTIILNFLIERTVIIKKRMYKIRKTADGHSELKILILLKNGRSKEIHSVKILDVLPSIIEPTEEFGTLKPEKIQQGTKGKRLIWEIGSLAPHEERIISYKVKSKIRLIGETTLPQATVHYTTKEGKVKTEHSTSIQIEHSKPKTQ
jgi:hypothetical protein